MTSWAYHPGLFSTGFQEVSRSSCFAVRPRAGAPGLLLGTGHVSHPFRFEHLYPPEENGWIYLLQDHHMRVTIELRNVRSGERGHGVCWGVAPCTAVNAGPPACPPAHRQEATGAVVVAHDAIHGPGSTFLHHSLCVLADQGGAMGAPPGRV